MSDTVVADALDALYDLFAADVTLAAAVSAGTLSMSDGPPAVLWSSPSMLVVGGRALVDDATPTTIASDWQSMGVSGGSADVNETIDIPCSISSLNTPSGASSGSALMRDCRRVAINLYAAAAAAARNSTLGLGHVMWVIPSTAQVHQLQTAEGAECTVDFTVRVRAQI